MTRLSSLAVRRVVPVLLIAVAVAACTKKEDRVLFDGINFKTKTSAVSKDDRKIFETVVRRPEQNINAALAAGEHDAKSYCLKSFGTSDIEWTRGPFDTNAPLYAEGGRLALNGRCVLW